MKKFLIGLFVVSFLAALGYRARAQLLGPPSSIPKEHAAMLHRDQLAIEAINRAAAEQARPYVDEQRTIFLEDGIDPNDPTLRIDYLTGKLSHNNGQSPAPPAAAPAPPAPLAPAAKPTTPAEPPKTTAPTTPPPAAKDSRKLPS